MTQMQDFYRTFIFLIKDAVATVRQLAHWTVFSLLIHTAGFWKTAKIARTAEYSMPNETAAIGLSLAM